MKLLSLPDQNSYIMGAAQIREELHEFINHADERILNLIYAMMKADVRHDEALEASIDKGLEQSKKKEVRPHEQVMREIRTRYKS
jgi:hypothetical protein